MTNFAPNDADRGGPGDAYIQVDTPDTPVVNLWTDKDRLTRERDALLAAAKDALTHLSEDYPVGWYPSRNLRICLQLKDAIALCEGKEQP